MVFPKGPLTGTTWTKWPTPRMGRHYRPPTFGVPVMTFVILPSKAFCGAGPSPLPHRVGMALIRPSCYECDGAKLVPQSPQSPGLALSASRQKRLAGRARVRSQPRLLRHPGYSSRLRPALSPDCRDGGRRRLQVDDAIGFAAGAAERAADDLAFVSALAVLADYIVASHCGIVLSLGGLDACA